MGFSNTEAADEYCHREQDAKLLGFLDNTRCRLFVDFIAGVYLRVSALARMTEHTEPTRWRVGGNQWRYGALRKPKLKDLFSCFFSLPLQLSLLFLWRCRPFVL